MSIVEQAYIVYSKKLLEGEARSIDLERVEKFTPLLSKICVEHPEYEYPIYYKVKLLQAIGLRDDALKDFIPFAKLKKNDFWVWELLAELLFDNTDLKFACYCKALSLKTPESFLVKIRYQFVSLLVKKEMYSEAKTEIDKIIASRKEMGWRIPNELLEYTQKDWYSNATSRKSNISLYKEYATQAEEIIWQDILEEVVVVEFINSEKSMLNFIKDQSKKGFFNYSSLLRKPQIGDILLVRFKENNKNDGFFKVLTARIADSNVQTNAMKYVDDTLRIAPTQKFGFLGDAFVDPKIIENNKLINGQRIKGQAIISYNAKKQKWGWRMITAVHI